MKYLLLVLLALGVSADELMTSDDKVCVDEWVRIVHHLGEQYDNEGKCSESWVKSNFAYQYRENAFVVWMTKEMQAILESHCTRPILMQFVSEFIFHRLGVANKYALPVPVVEIRGEDDDHYMYEWLESTA